MTFDSPEIAVADICVTDLTDSFIISLQSYLLSYLWYSITHSLFHSRLKSFLFCKSSLPHPFLFLIQVSLYGFHRLFAVTSEHIRLFTFQFFCFYTFLVVGSVRQIKLTYVGFRAQVKIASRIVSYRVVFLTLTVNTYFKPRVFTARYQPSAYVCLCLCLCLSQVGILLKRLNVGSHKQHHTIAQGLQFSDAKDLLQLHNFDLFRTCTSSFCTVAWQLARFQLIRRILGPSAIAELSVSVLFLFIVLFFVSLVDIFACMSVY